MFPDSDEMVWDDPTGEALELVDKGTHIDQLGASDDTVVAEFENVDTGGRRVFTAEQAENRLRSEPKDDVTSELSKNPFNL